VDHVDVHPAIAFFADLAVIQQAADKVDGAQFLEQRGVERGLVDAVFDIRGRVRRAGAHHWVDLHDQDVDRGRAAKERKEQRVAHVAGTVSNSVPRVMMM
jgi:hypothetical protein